MTVKEWLTHTEGIEYVYIIDNDSRTALWSGFKSVMMSNFKLLNLHIYYVEFIYDNFNKMIEAKFFVKGIR